MAIINAVLILGSLAIFFAIFLHLSAKALTSNDDTLTDQIDALLPQSQCAQCGYPGCRPYAMAIANQNAPINCCPPGGQATIQALADLLNKPVLTLNTKLGQEAPAQIARIDEATCIGCTLCIQACPVDAIIGAQKHLHTVIDRLCTGCKLCIEPCPMDCISMLDKNTEGRL